MGRRVRKAAENRILIGWRVVRVSSVAGYETVESKRMCRAKSKECAYVVVLIGVVSRGASRGVVDEKGSERDERKIARDEE